ncbi:MAG: transketolase [Kiritimatiellae bacterium]|nr:transketolase [Kiritimatiellia bacterium]
MSKAIDDATVQLAANTIRCLAIDAIEKAKSGHPGLPMGMADVAATLWLKYLRHDPADPAWSDRDRFVLSGGHGSMLLYSLLHLAGYKVSLDDLRQFRQVGSATPGHPEYGHTPGVETTTGPLGQGLATAVGMALAERMLAARVASDDAFKPVDHHTFVFCGDGDLMEGVSHEACSIAGHLALDRLVVFFDSNAITIEGATSLACSDDVAMRFKAYGWRVIETDGHDLSAIDKAIRKAIRSSGKPTLVICRTIIGKGSPNKQGTSACHGAPLGPDESAAAKRALGFDPDQTFVVPEAVRDAFDARAKSMRRAHRRWTRDFGAWRERHPIEAVAWNRHVVDPVPANLASALPDFDPAKPIATRAASGQVLNALARVMPSLVGGSADLAPSNNTYLKGMGDVAPGDYSGRNIHFGIRELAMGCMLSGMTLHGGFRPFGGTFFVFSDYCRPAIRLAALMRVPAIYVFTHDSFHVGEDGPTHEPVEHLAALRSIPGVTVIRPADATETAAAWIEAIENMSGPTALILTRQALPIIDRSVCAPASSLSRGGYVLWQSGTGTPDVMLIASGSEVSLCLEAAKRMAGKNVCVVSMPSLELFAAQTQEYRDSVIDPACANRLVVEAGTRSGWEAIAGPAGRILSMEGFGASGPHGELAKLYGFTTENIISLANF